MAEKPKPVPSLAEMYAFLDKQLALAARYKYWDHIDELLDRRNQIPELRKFLVEMGARGA